MNTRISMVAAMAQLTSSKPTEKRSSPSDMMSPAPWHWAKMGERKLSSDMGFFLKQSP